MNKEKMPKYFSDRNIGIIGLLTGLGTLPLTLVLAFFKKINIFYTIIIGLLPVIIGLIIAGVIYFLELKKFYKKYEYLYNDYILEKDSHNILKTKYSEISLALDLEKRNFENLQANTFNILKLNIFLSKMDANKRNNVVNKYYEEIMNIEQFERDGDNNG